MSLFSSVMLCFIIALSVFGLGGNLYAIFAFCLPGMRKQPTTPYLICIALSDIVAIGAGLPALFNIAGYALPISRMVCGIMIYSTYTACFFCSWSIVVATGQRMFAVVFPLLYRRYHSVQRSWCLIGVLVVLAFSCYSWIFAIVDAVKIDSGNKTYLECDIRSTTAARTAYRVMTTADIGCSFGIPVVLVAWMNFLMCNRLLKSRAERRRMMTAQRTAEQAVSMHGGCPEMVQLRFLNGAATTRATRNGNEAETNRRKQEARQERRLTICLVAISLVFAILNLPLYIYDLLVEFEVISGNAVTADTFYILYLSQFAVNYILYSVGFSSSLVPMWLRRLLRITN